MIITMWQLWTERNLIREEGRRRGAEFLFSHISLYAKEINDMKEGGVGPAPRRPAKWAKPLIGILKLNCDASYILGSGSGSWGFVIRDSDGDTVITGRGKVEHLLNAFSCRIDCLPPRTSDCHQSGYWPSDPRNGCTGCGVGHQD
jgi:hypothetical protein